MKTKKQRQSGFEMIYETSVRGILAIDPKISKWAVLEKILHQARIQSVEEGDTWKEADAVQQFIIRRFDEVWEKIKNSKN